MPKPPPSSLPPLPPDLTTRPGALEVVRYVRVPQFSTEGQSDPWGDGWVDILEATAQQLFIPSQYHFPLPDGSTREQVWEEIRQADPNLPYVFKWWQVEKRVGTQKTTLPFVVQTAGADKAKPTTVYLEPFSTVITMAVYELVGGPPGETTHTVNIVPILLDGTILFDKFLSFVDYFVEVVGHPELQDAANNSRLDTTAESRTVRALALVGATGPFQFNHWTFDPSDISTEYGGTPSLDFQVAKGQTGTLYACYRIRPGSIPIIEPNVPAREFFRPADDPRLGPIRTGLALSDLAAQVAPEVRDQVLDAAILQTTIATDAPKRGMRSELKSSNGPKKDGSKQRRRK